VGAGSVTPRLKQFLLRSPRIGREVYLAQGAVVVGDVTLGDRSSVWHNAVLRGDINRIVVGEGTNIQDNAVIHLANAFPCLIGCQVTVGHAAVVHACTVEDEVLIGMSATILDGAVIGTQSIVGAGSVVASGMRVPPGSLVLGVPGRIARALTLSERRQIRKWAEKYVQNARFCLQHHLPSAQPFRMGGG